MASYVYDPYGNIVSATGSIAQKNPLRYRGYYYDQETGFYYLNARYYDPKVGRFLNADAVECLGVNGDTSSYNLFAYCGNNPVSRKDDQGMVWETAFDLITLGTSIIDVVMHPQDPLAWAGAVGDAVDLIPFVTGVGEAVKATKLGKLVSKGASSSNNIIVTEDVIRNAMKDAPLKTQQKAVSIPVIQAYVDRVLAGEINIPNIKVDGDIIVDGNHRYITSRITGIDVGIQAWSGGKPDNVIDWADVILDSFDWGNR